MCRIKINDLTKNNKLKVSDMLEGCTYKITYSTGDSYNVLVCYCCDGAMPYIKEGERIVAFLSDGALNVIDDTDIIEIVETTVEINITN